MLSVEKEIEKLSTAVDQLMNSMQYLLRESTEVINIKNFNQREQSITDLCTYLKSLSEISLRFTSAINQAKQTHEKETALVDALLNKKVVANTEQPIIPHDQTIPAPLHSNDSGLWSTVSRKSKNNNTKNLKTYALAVEHQASSTTKYQSIPITDNFSIPAIVVQNFVSVKQDGELYYVESAEHFAIKILGQLFHGNVGIIYTDEKNPEKIKDCKFAGGCIKRDKCDYYHDPTKFENSHDHRNHSASSFLYTTPEGAFKNRSRSRKFGSRRYLETDLALMQDEDVSRYRDQVTHDLLCALLLGMYHKHTSK